MELLQDHEKEKMEKRSEEEGRPGKVIKQSLLERAKEIRGKKDKEKVEGRRKMQRVVSSEGEENEGKF